MKKSFIHTVTSQNLKNIEEDLRADSENVNSFYVVDTFDVIETCFPSLYTNFENSNKNLEIAVYLASQHLFFESKNQPVILDEYKVEIFSFWAKIKKTLEENYEVGKEQTILNLISKYKLLKSSEEISRFVEEEISLLLSISINTLGITPTERYNQLINNRLQINKFKCKNDKDSLYVNKLFRLAKPKKNRLLKIYQQFVDHNKYSLSSKSKDDIYIYLENTLRDITVFDRILTINEQFEREYEVGNLKEQYRLLYLSSVPQKSVLIQKLYKKFHQSELQDAQLGFLTSSNIHRNNIDIHLHDLITSSHKNNGGAGIAKLTEELNNLVKKDGTKEFYETDFHKEIPTNEGVRKGMFDYSKLESLFYINKTLRSHLDDLKKTLENLRKERGSDKDSESELSRIFEKCLKLLDNESIDKNTKIIRTIVQSHNDTLRAEISIEKTLLNSIKRDKPLFYKMHNTSDSVKSIIQSYPILLFYNIKGKESLHQSVEDIFSKFITNSESNSMTISYKPDRIGIYTGFYLELYSLFLSLLLDSPTRLSEEALPSRLEAIEVKASSAKIKSRKKEVDGIVKYQVEINSDEELQIEIQYFMVWCLRRLGRYDEGISVAIENFEKYSDPRFLHGKALCLKSKFYYDKKAKPAKELFGYLQESLRDFLIAEKKFKAIKKENDYLFEHIKIGISNSICDTYVQLSILSKSDSTSMNSIKDIRDRIDFLSQGLIKIDSSIQNHPAYCHTACEVYLESARLAILDSNINEALNHYELARKFYILIQEKEHLESYSEMPETSRRFNRIGRKLFLRTKTE